MLHKFTSSVLKENITLTLDYFAWTQYSQPDKLLSQNPEKMTQR